MRIQFTAWIRIVFLIIVCSYNNSKAFDLPGVLPSVNGKKKKETPAESPAARLPKTPGSIAGNQSGNWLKLPGSIPARSIALKPFSLSFKNSIDPIRFSVINPKSSVAVGEEIELTIRAELLDVAPSLMFFFEEQKSFSLKLLLPDGFDVMGGTYTDFIGATLNLQSQPVAEYTIKGKFTRYIEQPVFILLRGPKEASAQSLFEKKAELKLIVKNSNEKTTHIRIKNNSSRKKKSPTDDIILPEQVVGLCPSAQYISSVIKTNNSITVNATKSNSKIYLVATSGRINRELIIPQNGGAVTFANLDTTQVYIVSIEPPGEPRCPWREYVKFQSQSYWPRPFQGEFGAANYFMTSVTNECNIITFTSFKKDILIISGTIDSTGGTDILDFELKTITTDGGSVSFNLKDYPEEVFSVYFTVLDLGPDSVEGFQWYEEFFLNKRPRVIVEPNTISSPQNVTLTTSGCNGTVEWSGPGVSGIGSTLIVRPTNTTTYLARCVVDSCQSPAASATVRFITVPAPIIRTNHTSLCKGDTLQLSADGCEGLVRWSNGLTGSSIRFAPTATATYSATCVVSNVASEASNAIGVSVQTAPTGATATTGQTSYTTGQTVSLTATATGATRYEWSGPGGFMATGQSISRANATVGMGGLYTVRAYSGAACPAVATVHVVVQPSVNCTLAFDGEPRADCDFSAADTTRRGRITVTVKNQQVTSSLQIALYQPVVNGGQTSYQLTSILPNSPAVFTGLKEGTYRIDAYEVTGIDTCQAGSRLVTVDCDTTVSGCNIRIKAVDSQPTETDVLPRVGGILQPLLLSVEHLEGASLAGYTYQWTRTAGTGSAVSLATTPTVSATAIGEYAVKLMSLTDTCTAYLTVRSKPCTPRTHTYACGTTPAIPLPDNGSRLSNLAVGDTIRAADFDIIVTEVTGGGSEGWNGVGYTEIPYLKNTKIAIELKGVVVNDCYELVGGTAQSAYDPSWMEVKDVDGVLKATANQIDLLKQLLADYKDTPEQKAQLQIIVNSLVSEQQSLSAVNPEATQVIAIGAIIESAQCLLTSSQSSTANPGGRLVAQDNCSAPDVLAIVEANTNQATAIPGPMGCFVAAVLDYGIQYVVSWGKLKYIDNQNVDFTDFRRINQEVDLIDVGVSCGMAFFGIDSKAVDLAIAAGNGIRSSISAKVDQFKAAHGNQEPSISQVLDLVRDDFSGVLFDAVISTATTFIAQAAGEKFGPIIAAKISGGVKKFLAKSDDFIPQAFRDKLNASTDVAKNATIKLQARFLGYSTKILRPKATNEFIVDFHKSLISKYSTRTLHSHHIPSSRFMELLMNKPGFENLGLVFKDNTCQNCIALSLDATSGFTKVGRHNRTYTFALNTNSAEGATYYGLTPSNALIADVQDLIRILKDDGLWNSESHNALKSLIQKNSALFPNVFDQTYILNTLGW